MVRTAINVYSVRALDEPTTAVLDRVADVGELICVKNRDTSVDRGFVELGDGDGDMRACAEAAAEVGSEWLIYERDDLQDPAGTIDHGAEFLDSL